MFYDSSFLAGKEANGAVAVDKSGQKIERGKNQCPGAGRRGRWERWAGIGSSHRLPPLGRPRSVGYLLRFSSGVGTEGTARAKSERRIKARGFTRGRKLARYRNLGRKRKRLQAAHRRARVDICRQSSRSSSSGGAGKG